MNFIQPISEELFRSKYMINGEATPEQVFADVAAEIARVEDPKHREEVQKQFEELLSSGKFIPGGRILANARSYTSLKSRNYNNCFTIDIDDSMEGIYSSVYEDAMISRMGGGVGFDVSKIRPEGSKTSNGGDASGPISFLEVFNASAKTIQSGGSRRCLPLWYEVVTDQDGTSKKIGDLVIGDLIYFDGEKYSVNEIYHNGKQDLVKIVTKNGWHVSTANHKWLVYDLKTGELVWKEAKELAKPDQGPLYAFIVPKQPFNELPH